MPRHHSLEHDSHHSHEHHSHHSYEHQHEHEHQHHSHDHHHFSNSIESDDEIDVPSWKQRALALEHLGGGKTFRDPPFGHTWDTQVSLSAHESIFECSPRKMFHAHFDCFSGAAGDMMLAACLDASPNPSQLLHTIVQNIRLGIPDIAHEFDIHFEKVSRGYGCISGTKVTVKSMYHHETVPPPRIPQQHHPPPSPHPPAQPSTPLRNLPHIRQLLLNSSPLHIPTIVRQQAIETFTELAMAESFTHGSSSLDLVHFHEVGAIDSIVDIVGTLLALYHLHVQTFSCSRLPMGDGMVWTDHGQLPVPAYATLRLMIGMKTCKGPGGNETMTGELVTPTAAALLRVLTGVAQAERTQNHQTKIDVTDGRPPPFTPRFIGIGAGTKDFPNHANVLRLILGDDVLGDKDRSKHLSLIVDAPLNKQQLVNVDTIHVDKPHSECLSLPTTMTTTAPTINQNLPQQSTNSLYHMDILTLLEANIDDASPEILAYAIELLLTKGALDAWVTPIVMKKGRSAHMLSCLIGTTDDNTISLFLQLIFRHTTTIGIRIQRNIERAALHRTMIQVSIPFTSKEEDYKVDVKVCTMGKEVMSIKPEFDQCKKISQCLDISVETISNSAKASAVASLSNINRRD